MAQIVSIAVEGLLDYFDHAIIFPADWNYLLIYGPNGVGKTKLLELVYAIYTESFDDVASTPFAKISINHDDETTLSIDRSEDTESNTHRLDISLHSPNTLVPIIGIYYDRGGTELRRYLLLNTPWTPVGRSGNLWRDRTDGEVLEWEELIDRYPFPDRAVRNRGLRSEVPTEIGEFLRKFPVHFIKTQRLLYEEAQTQDRPYQARREQPRLETIAAYSANLKKQLSAALGENSKRTQQLDRSFPKRLLDMRQIDIDPEEIRERYRAQSQKRKDLAEIGLINSEVDLPLPDRTLNSWELNVLHTYLDDTDEKLRTFDHVVARVTLLRDIANTRFLNKTLSVNAENGIIVTRQSDGMTIPPAGLSSGEQHELVLMYDLLFNVQANALVLIDEPEISLHIAWQKSFIKDIERIADLASLRFVIATHSPQIINKSWNRTAELGPRDPMDELE